MPKKKAPEPLALPVADLHRLVTPVLPFASRDTLLPLCTMVWVQSRSGIVTATATDRYRLGISQVAVDGAPDMLIAVSAGQLKTVLRLFPKPRARAAYEQIRISTDGTTIRFAGAERAVEFQTVDHFPKRAGAHLANPAAYLANLHKLARTAITHTTDGDEQPAQPSVINPDLLRIIPSYAGGVTVRDAGKMLLTVAPSFLSIGMKMGMTGNGSAAVSRLDEDAKDWAWLTSDAEVAA